MAELITTKNPIQTLQEEIKRDRASRIQRHKEQVAGFKTKGLMALTKMDRPLNLIADGDSWFDYQLPWPSHTDIIAQLPNVSNIPFPLKLAHMGDPATVCIGATRRKQLTDSLNDPSLGPFDAILISGGGDDLVGDQFCMWLNEQADSGGDPNKAMDNSRADLIFDIIQDAYTDLIALRNECNPTIPIFVHNYDFALPTGKGAPCGIGPWLLPSLVWKGWKDPIQGAAIVKLFLLRFDALLKTFADDHNNNMIKVQTQGTLGPGDWDNELHPKPPGFAKMARLFAAALNQKFPGRVTVNP